VQGSRQAGVRVERQIVQGFFDHLFRVGNASSCLHLRCLGQLLSISFFLLRMPLPPPAGAPLTPAGIMACFRSLGRKKGKGSSSKIIHGYRGFALPLFLPSHLDSRNTLANPSVLKLIRFQCTR